MFSPAADDLTPAEVLAAAEAVVAERRAVQLQDLQLVAAWADLHADDPQARPGAVPRRLGGDRLVEVGGDGAPLVADLCIHELAIARQTHPAATRATMGDVLDLRHRLPLTWTVVQGLGCEAWVALKVARMSRALDRHQVGLVDTAVAQVIAGTAPSRVLALAEAKVIEADTAAHAARLADARRRRGVWASRTDTETGNRTLFARTDPGTVAWVDAVLERIVDALLARPQVLRDHHPDLPADLDDLTREELRAIAFGWLARPEDVLALLAAEPIPSDQPDTGPAGRRRQRAVVHLHLHESALAGSSSAVGRVEGIGPLLLEQIRALLGHAHVTINPVLDLEDHDATSAYEFPTVVRARTRLRTLGDVFPYAASAATMTGRYDHDHPVPYDPGGPPGQTGDHNDAPLTRWHHRAKTHAGYRVTQLGPGTYLWTTPHGLHRLVDPTGTKTITDLDARAMTRGGAGAAKLGA